MMKRWRTIRIVVSLAAVLAGAGSERFRHDTGAHVCGENDRGSAVGGARAVRRQFRGMGRRRDLDVHFVRGGGIVEGSAHRRAAQELTVRLLGGSVGNLHFHRFRSAALSSR